MDTGHGEMITDTNLDSLLERGAEFDQQIREQTGSPASIFMQGEVLEIKNSRFEIMRVGQKEMHLRILRR